MEKVGGKSGWKKWVEKVGGKMSRKRKWMKRRMNEEKIKKKLMCEWYERKCVSPLCEYQIMSVSLFWNCGDIFGFQFSGRRRSWKRFFVGTFLKQLMINYSFFFLKVSRMFFKKKKDGGEKLKGCLFVADVVICRPFHVKKMLWFVRIHTFIDLVNCRR